MAQLTFSCPHCGVSNMTMPVIGSVVVPKEFISADKLPPFGLAFLACGRCWQPVAARITSKGRNTPDHHAGFTEEYSQALAKTYDLTAGNLHAAVVRTPDQRNEIPAHLSDAVAKAYKSAERNYTADDGEDAAAMLYRRALDVAIREKHPEIKGQLGQRINKLIERGLLPPAMKEWADQIRLIGNEGAHEPEGVTLIDLKPMRGFTEAFLRYFITIPFEVAVRRGQIDESGNPIEAAPTAVAD